MALAEDFQDLCRRLKLHDRDFCSRTLGLVYPGPAPLALAEEFEQLAGRVKDLGADDDDHATCINFAVGIRKEHAEAQAKERRLKEQMEQEMAAMERERERRNQEEDPGGAARASSSPTTPNKSAQRGDLSAASAAAHTQFDFVLQLPSPPAVQGQSGSVTTLDILALPDEALRHILQFLLHRDVGRMACVCKQLKATISEDDDVWKSVQLRGRRHPTFAAHRAWHKAFVQSLALDDAWRHRHHKLHAIGHHTSYISCTSLFEDLLLSGSGDHTLSLVRLTPHARAMPKDTSSGHRNSVAGSCVGHMQAVTACQLLDGAHAISASSDGELRLWDISAMASRSGGGSGSAPQPSSCWSHVIAEPSIRSPTIAATYAPYSQGPLRIACGGTPTQGEAHNEYAACVLQADEGEVIPVARLFTNQAAVYAMQWWGAPASQHRVFAACTGALVRSFDLRMCGLGHDRGDVVRVGARGSVRCLQVEDNFMCCGSADGYLRAFDLRKTDQPFASLRTHTDCVNALALDLRLGWMVSGGDDCSIACVRVPSMIDFTHVRTSVGVLSLSMDHSRLVAGCEDISLRVWDYNVDKDSFIDIESLRTALSMMETKRTHAGSASNGGMPQSANRS